MKRVKRTTFRQPPAVASVDEWVDGTPAPAEPEEKPARLTIDIPPDLHGRFKAACARSRTKMKDEVLRFITDWTQKHENTQNRG
jgi:hypothetical protein